eukprot:3533407-Pleurochrysis_carterae.AAC.3
MQDRPTSWPAPNATASRLIATQTFAKPTATREGVDSPVRLVSQTCFTVKCRTYRQTIVAICDALSGLVKARRRFGFSNARCSAPLKPENKASRRRLLRRLGDINQEGRERGDAQRRRDATARRRDGS